MTDTAKKLKEWAQSKNAVIYVINHGKRRVIFFPEEVTGLSENQIDAMIATRLDVKVRCR